MMLSIGFILVRASNCLQFHSLLPIFLFTLVIYKPGKNQFLKKNLKLQVFVCTLKNKQSYNIMYVHIVAFGHFMGLENVIFRSKTSNLNFSFPVFLIESGTCLVFSSYPHYKQANTTYGMEPTYIHTIC